MYHVMYCTFTSRVEFIKVVCCHRGTTVTATVISVQHLSPLLPCRFSLDLASSFTSYFFKFFYTIISDVGLGLPKKQTTENLHFESK